VWMPAPQSGSPMTYSVDGKQYIIVAVSGGAYSGEYIAFSLPTSEMRPTTQGGQHSKPRAGKGAARSGRPRFKRRAYDENSASNRAGARADRCGAGLVTPRVSGQAGALPSTKNGEWPMYTADLRGSKYSPLA
jgi:hypothetical protein